MATKATDKKDKDGAIEIEPESSKAGYEALASRLDVDPEALPSWADMVVEKFTGLGAELTRDGLLQAISELVIPEEA